MNDAEPASCCIPASRRNAAAAAASPRASACKSGGQVDACRDRLQSRRLRVRAELGEFGTRARRARAARRRARRAADARARCFPRTWRPTAGRPPRRRPPGLDERAERLAGPAHFQQFDPAVRARLRGFRVHARASRTPLRPRRTRRSSRGARPGSCARRRCCSTPSRGASRAGSGRTCRRQRRRATRAACVRRDGGAVPALVVEDLHPAEIRAHGAERLRRRRARGRARCRCASSARSRSPRSATTRAIR